MKICIDPGHGGSSPGAVFQLRGGGPMLKEKEICFAMARAALDELRPRHQVILTREADVFVPLHVRAQLANTFDADAFISIHTNADPDPDEPGMNEAKGSEIWVYPGSRSGWMLAECVRNALPLVFPGRKFRGIKESNFAVLRLTHMPAILIETAFIDTEESTKLTDPWVIREAARVIALGAEEYATIKNL